MPMDDNCLISDSPLKEEGVAARENTVQLATEFLRYRHREMKKPYYDKFCAKVMAELFSIFFWKYTEASGKYAGCCYWSVRAASRVAKDIPLRHEHLVPRKILIDMFFKLREDELHKIEELFRRYCIGVVVTAEEDRLLNKAGFKQKMPADNWLENPWVRYAHVEIKIARNPRIPAEMYGLLERMQLL